MREGWAVVINAGKFDWIIFESITKVAAETYYSLVLPLSNVPIEMKPERDVRHLKEEFVSEDIALDLYT